jgi:glycosyltransferase involved in cell wall biosynthesis
MARLAWFTPLRPAKSGIAWYSEAVLSRLLSKHSIDVFVDAEPDGCVRPSGAAAVFAADEFTWRHQLAPYDLVVYQMGNAPYHDYMWAYAFRYPGLVVLHDGQLHHARARMLLEHKRVDDYRAEFLYNHPDADSGLVELGQAGLLGSLTYLWPMLRAVVESSRMVVVHNHWLADQVREQYSSATVEVVEMGVPQSAPREGARRAIRSKYGLHDDAVVFTALGKVTAEKRIREAIRSLAAIAESTPAVRLLLAGEPVPTYDMRAEARRLGVEDKVVFLGYVPEDMVDDVLAASDVTLCMRWPTSRETSASWLRCLAAEKPSIVTDLVHTADVPVINPRDWTVLGAEGSDRAVSVSVEMIDEPQLLTFAMRRLARDGRMRARLGVHARELWARRFQMDRMIIEYEQAITSALACAAPEAAAVADQPPHLRADGFAWTAELLRESRISPDRIAGLWTETRGRIDD